VIDLPSLLFVTTVPITLEAFLAPFAGHFRRLGWRVDALSNGASANEHIAGAFDHRYDVPWSRNPLDPRNLVGSAATVRRVVAQGRYDIVWVHTPIASFVTRYALRRLTGAERPLVIYTAHGFHFYEGGRPLSNMLYRSMERVAAPWTDYLVTINSEDYRAAKGLGGIDPARVRYIPGIGVDTDRFSPERADPRAVAATRSELDVAQDAFMLTMVAEMAKVKRHEFLLEALARARDARVVLVLVGDGPLEARLKERAAALGVTDRIRWAGYRRDVPSVLAASDALVLVSEREGLPRSVLEAMAAGRPVIGTATRGIADAVGEDAGWIVPKHDVDALARAIDAAASDPAETSRRGAAARDRAVAEFALPRVIDEYEELFREALASRV
jgi:glycosyltransferase involved in cell wall biosynthesis